MPTYNTDIARVTNVAGPNIDALVPTPVVANIIQELPHYSVVMDLARRTTMSSLTVRQPVLDVLPVAYFVTGDTGLKQTSTQAWKNVTLTAEELAVIVPVPQAYFDDAMVPIWDEVRPRIVAALGIAIDKACLFGTGKPSTWSTDIYTAATAAGNHVTAGSGADLGVDIAKAAQMLTKEGFNTNGFAAEPGFGWQMVTLRSTQGIPIYQANTVAGNAPGGSLYGYQLREALNGSFDPTKASLFMGNWDDAVIGVRQDITFTMHTEGVIQDGSGAIQFNLLQQDMIAIRAVIRLGFATANPVTELQSDSTKRYPFAYVGPIAGLS